MPKIMLIRMVNFIGVVLLDEYMGDESIPSDHPLLKKAGLVVVDIN